MEKTEKYTVFRSPDDGEVYAVRNEPPRFTVKYTPGGEASDVSFLDFKDAMPPDPILLAKLMGGVGRAIAHFLHTERHERGH